MWDLPGARACRPILGGLPGWLLAATLTAPVIYFDPHREFVRSDLYSTVGIATLKQRRLSLRAARQLAMRILAETEQRLWQERAEEAEFLAALWRAETDGLREDRV
jgi:hypothetical protein